MSRVLKKNDDGTLSVDFLTAGAVIAVLAGVWPLVSWFAGVDRTVFGEYPVHVQLEAANLEADEKRDAALARLADTLASKVDEELREQIALEMKCEDPQSDMPRDYCRDLLQKKRLREARDRARGGRGES